MVQQKWPRGRADLLPATAAESLSSISSSSPQNTPGYGRALGAPQLGMEPRPLGAQSLVVPPMLLTAARCCEISACSRSPAPRQCQESTQGANPAGHYCHSHLPARPQGCCTPTPPPCQVHPTWLMSLVHAAFSCLDEATRITVKDEASFGSTTILKSRWSMSCPEGFALEQKNHRQCL